MPTQMDHGSTQLTFEKGFALITVGHRVTIGIEKYTNIWETTLKNNLLIVLRKIYSDKQ